MKVSAKFYGDGVIANLKAIHKVDIPAAKASAFSRVGEAATRRSAKALSKRLGVPLWMFNGSMVDGDDGRKRKGSRLGRSKYIRSMDGIFVFFRNKPLNPAGTIHRRAYVTATRDGLKMGKRKYPNSFIKRKHYPQPAVYQRVGVGLERQEIKLGESETSTVVIISKAVVREIFPDRFIHELKRRDKSRGTRAGAD